MPWRCRSRPKSETIKPAAAALCGRLPAKSCRSVNYHCRLLMVYEGRLATCDVPRSNVGIS